MKYQLEDRNKRRSLRVVTKKIRDTSPVAALKDIDSHSMADDMLRCGTSFKIHLEQTQRPSMMKGEEEELNFSNETEKNIGERSITPIEKISQHMRDLDNEISPPDLNMSN